MTSALFGEEDVRAAYRFLAHAGHGVTELRVISPDHGVVGIGFFDAEEPFVEACASVNGTANIYVGIQPRPRHFLDAAPNRIEHLRSGAHDRDIERLTALVVDIDPVRPKDVASTDEELARAVSRAGELAAWIESKGFGRPVRNMSGNGCHLWFALPPLEITAQNRDEVTSRLKAFEARLRQKFAAEDVKIDSIYNLSRIIKVIGTLSVKGTDTADRPRRLSRSLDPFVRREDQKLLDAILTMPLPAAAAPAADDAPAQPVAIGAELGPWVHALVASNTRLTALFEGRGKTAIGPDGRRLDTSSSGYDFSLALALAQKGVSDPAELATALWHRPDGAARAKGEAYVLRTVERALKLARTIAGGKGGSAGADGEAGGDIDFVVERIVIRDSQPPIYHLHIGEQVLILGIDDLISPRRFKKRFVERLRRVPRLPGDKAQMSWDDYVNLWLASAEVEHQPPEASARELRKEEIAAIIDNLGEAESTEDLDRGKAIRVHDRRGFKTRTVLRAIRESGPGEIGSHELCDLLRDLGCESRLARLDGRRVRVWVAPAAWPQADEADGSDEDLPDPAPDEPPEEREPGAEG